MKRLLAAAAAVVFLTSCLQTAGPLPLSLSVTSSPAAPAIGDTVVFVTNSEGDALLLIDIAYGDGGIESVDLPGARTARTVFKHVYGAAGTYNATVDLVQADSSTKSAITKVTVH